jgi:tetratricopeptide (TPR) repeat protein
VVAVVAGMIVLLGAILVGASYRTTSAPSTETQLASAIARGNLISPPGESAQFYYNRLKSEGAGADILKRYSAQLVPALKARPYKMLEDFAVPGSSDSSPSEWEETGRLLTWAAELAPDDKPLAARAAYCTGRASYMRQQTDAALELWGRANQMDSTWPLPPNGVGLIYNERRQYATARPYLLEAIRRDPKWAVPYNNLGTSYFYEKNYNEAASYYEKAASLAPQWARPHAWLGDIAYERKDFCTAQQEYQSALDLATPGMSSWNPQRIESKRDSAAAKCTQSQYAPRRIEFGVGGTTASLRGSTSGTDAYVISAGAGQTMTVSLTTEGAVATLRVLDTGMNQLGEGAWWQGTLPYKGDYNIQVTAAGGTFTYTLRVTIPPLG